MGVTLNSKNYECDFGYNGFNRLRTTIAELVGSDLGEHYKKLDEPMLMDDEERAMFYHKYDLETQKLTKKYPKASAVFSFLYQSDCEGKLACKDCKQLYDLIKDYDNDSLYGYCGRPDCAKFRDFKQIVKDCVETKTSMEWS